MLGLSPKFNHFEVGSSLLPVNYTINYKHKSNLSLFLFKYEYNKMNTAQFSLKFAWWTYCAPGSSPPLVVSRGHVPAAVARVVSWVLWISIGLVIDALTVVDGGTGGGSALLLRCRLLIWVTERLVHWLVVVRTVNMPGHSSHTASHRTLGER